MRLYPYLTFDGQCEEALRFYEQALGGEIQFMMTYQETPMASHVPPEWGQKILHATFTLADQTFAGADTPPGTFQKPQGFHVTLDIESPGEAEAIFERLADQGTTQVPIQETFWASRFGMLTDRFGIPWMINCGKTQ